MPIKNIDIPFGKQRNGCTLSQSKAGCPFSS